MLTAAYILVSRIDSVIGVPVPPLRARRGEGGCRGIDRTAQEQPADMCGLSVPVPVIRDLKIRREIARTSRAQALTERGQQGGAERAVSAS